jgi:hypothetical protein
MGGDHEFLGFIAFAIARAVKTAHAVGSKFAQPFKFGPHYFADLVFLAWNAMGFGKPAEEVCIHRGKGYRVNLKRSS